MSFRTIESNVLHSGTEIQQRTMFYSSEYAGGSPNLLAATITTWRPSREIPLSTLVPGCRKAHTGSSVFFVETDSSLGPRMGKENCV